MNHATITATDHLIGREVFIYGLGYIVWDGANARALEELEREIENIAPPRKTEEQ